MYNYLPYYNNSLHYLGVHAVIKSTILVFSYGIGTALLIAALVGVREDNDRTWTVLTFIKSVMLVIGGMVFALIWTYILWIIILVISGTYEFIISLI